MFHFQGHIYKDISVVDEKAMQIYFVCWNMFNPKITQISYLKVLKMLFPFIYIFKSSNNPSKDQYNYILVTTTKTQ